MFWKTDTVSNVWRIMSPTKRAKSTVAKCCNDTFLSSFGHCESFNHSVIPPFSQCSPIPINKLRYQPIHINSGDARYSKKCHKIRPLPFVVVTTEGK